MGTVTNNTILLTGASIVQKALSFVYFVILAHFYGAEMVGKYTYALAFVTIFSIIVDGGLTPVLIRLVARNRQHSRSTLYRIIGIKIVLAVVTYAALAVTVVLVFRAQQVWYLIAIAAIVMTIDSLNMTLFGVLRGFQNLWYESFGVIVSQIGSFVIGASAAWYGMPIVVPIIALGVASVMHCMVALYGLHKTMPPADFAADAAVADVPLAREAFPFALSGFFARGYSFLDTILLGSISFTQSGLYSVPNKLTYAFQFIPLALSASLYPAFSRMLHDENADQVAARWHEAQRYLLLVAMIVIASLIALRRQLLNFYGSEFVLAEITLLILSLSLVFAFVAYPIGALLNAAGKQHLQTTAMGITLAVNATMNFILIPRLGSIGAAISAVAGNAVLFAAGSYFAHTRVTHLPWGRFFKDAGAICVLAIIGGFATWGAVHAVPWPVAGIAGAIVYGALIIAFKFVSVAHIKHILNGLRNRV